MVTSNESWGQCLDVKVESSEDLCSSGVSTGARTIQNFCWRHGQWHSPLYELHRLPRAVLESASLEILEISLDVACLSAAVAAPAWAAFKGAFQPQRLCDLFCAVKQMFNLISLQFFSCFLWLFPLSNFHLNTCRLCSNITYPGKLGWHLSSQILEVHSGACCRVGCHRISLKYVRDFLDYVHRSIFVV